MMRQKKLAEIGVIGGSGLYSLFKGGKEIKVETPYGAPSDKIVIDQILKKRVAFLPRHSRLHDLPPHRVNYRLIFGP